jgi:microcystin-dependent protein
MTTPYLGQITMFAGNFAPRGWAFCNGQTLAIAQYNALFALLGTTYGGNGVTTFQLPNLQSRLPAAQGQGGGLSSYALGQVGGVPTVSLSLQNMPAHTHILNATTALATTVTIGTSTLPAQPTGSIANPHFYAAPMSGQPAPSPQAMAPGACGPAGGNQAHNNMMPSLCITFVIALQGIFPSRS